MKILTMLSHLISLNISLAM